MPRHPHVADWRLFFSADRDAEGRAESERERAGSGDVGEGATAGPGKTLAGEEGKAACVPHGSSLALPSDFSRLPVEAERNSLPSPGQLAPAPPLAPTVVDVGCGFGGLTVALAEAYPEERVLGLEIRAKVTDYVRARVRAIDAKRKRAREAADEENEKGREDVEEGERRGAGSAGDSGVNAERASKESEGETGDSAMRGGDDRERPGGEPTLSSPSPIAPSTLPAASSPSSTPSPACSVFAADAARCNAMRDFPRYFGAGQLSQLFFPFADPHFKAANHRRRIVQPTLVDEYAHSLRVGGKLYVATDVEELFDWEVKHLEAHPLLERVPDAELQTDRSAALIWTATEESKKVARSGGAMWRAAFVRVRDPSEATGEDDDETW